MPSAYELSAGTPRALLMSTERTVPNHGKAKPVTLRQMAGRSARVSDAGFNSACR
jgi:hypothetical protein